MQLRWVTLDCRTPCSALLGSSGDFPAMGSRVTEMEGQGDTAASLLVLPLSKLGRTVEAACQGQRVIGAEQGFEGVTLDCQHGVLSTEHYSQSVPRWGARPHRGQWTVPTSCLSQGLSSGEPTSSRWAWSGSSLNASWLGWVHHIILVEPDI